MTRHHKFLGSNAKPVEAGVVDPSVVQSTINPSVEENTMTTENIKATNEEIIDVEVRAEEVSAEEATKGLKELAKKKSAGFRKGSVAYAGLVSGFISSVAMLAVRSSNEDVKLSNVDILKRTAVNVAAAATVQTAVQALSKRVNNSEIGSYATAHLVGCVTAPVGMRTMIKAGFGADGYKEHGTTEKEYHAEVQSDIEFTAESAPAENAL